MGGGREERKGEECWDGKTDGLGLLYVLYGEDRIGSEAR